MNNPADEIHPDLRQMARMTPRFSFSKKNLWLINLLTRWMPVPKAPPGLRIENLAIPGVEERKPLRLRFYQPESGQAATPALLWFHGGGYVMGKPGQDDGVCCQFVRRLGIRVVSVDYRTAPKHPFPAALEDAYAALTWITAQAGRLGIDPRRIAVGGNSAGGGLAASLAQLAHDRQELQPVFQLLVYPMLDDRTVLRADLEANGNVTWTQESNRFGWESYLGQSGGAETVPAYSVPARRSDLSGLPPAWIGVGTLDIFHDEDTAYARRLIEHGVDCELVTVPGGFHGFDVVAPQATIALEFRQSQVTALKRGLLRSTGDQKEV